MIIFFCEKCDKECDKECDNNKTILSNESTIYIRCHKVDPHHASGTIDSGILSRAQLLFYF